MEENNEVKDKNYTAVLLEEISGNVKLLAEGISGLDEKMDRKFGEMDERFDAIDRRFGGIDARLNGMDKRFDGIDKNFKAVFEYLSRIEDEFLDLKATVERIEKKQEFNRKEIEEIKGRLEKVEESLKKHKVIFHAAAESGA
jgi:archaellum component FlaC